VLLLLIEHKSNIYILNNFNCKNVEVDTVHGFQGREKDVIVFSTVADKLNEFIDDPNVINVSVSRAIDKFIIVTPYEYKGKNSSILSLINYINYNNLEVVQSEINSVFDLLYKVNEDKKKSYLSNRLIFSKFDSENIMFNVICEILNNSDYNNYAVKPKVYPIRKLVRNFDVLNFDERRYINNNAHVDFLIYDKFNKMPLLAIEVDGYTFHRSKKQLYKDAMKNEILRKINIPLIRFSTKDSKIEDKLVNKLNEVINSFVD